MHANRQVMAIEPGHTIIYPSETEAIQAYGLKSTSQLKRLIDNEQNLPHTRIFLEWWEGEPVSVVTETTTDMMGFAHLRKMRRMGVKVVDSDEY